MKTFFFKSNNCEKDSVIWNMIGSLLNAFQSVIFLMILTRTVGLIDSGIFTIAYANANLFLCIGKYGMRNYQVSDVNLDFNFKEYLKSRWITTFLMLIVSIFYTLYTANVNNYNIEKTQIIIWMCMFKLIDCFEDVYVAEYQKRGRLDVGAKIMTLRMAFTILLFGFMIAITKNLLLTLIISTIVTIILEILFVMWTYPNFKTDEVVRKGKVLQLLVNCFPVAISSFLSFYIGNAPKYSIDAQLSDELQACYGFIAMPVFVIGLLNGFVFTPILFKLSCMWTESKITQFVKTIIIQSFIIFGITVVCLVGAYLFGIPILSFLYNTDLSLYKAELLILLVGGGFLGLSGILNAVITIMRRQNALLIGYAFVAVLALVLSNSIVKTYQMMGAAILYMTLMFLLCCCFLCIFIYGIKKRK